LRAAEAAGERLVVASHIALSTTVRGAMTRRD